VERTRELVVDAFVALRVARDGFGAVSISDIRRRAMIHRATFYRHFEDKDDLVERGVEMLLSSIGNRIDEENIGDPDSFERAERRVERTLSILAERREFSLRLFSGAVGPGFRNRVEAFFEKYILERRIERIPEGTVEFSIPRRLLLAGEPGGLHLEGNGAILPHVPGVGRRKEPNGIGSVVPSRRIFTLRFTPFAAGDFIAGPTRYIPSPGRSSSQASCLASLPEQVSVPVER
jgi:AcrR family transcriptional regulator